MQDKTINFSRIKQVAVLGSGVMGSRIACHLANAGLSVFLLDIPGEGTAGKSHEERNRNTLNALQQAIKSKPSPLFLSAFASRIRVGNLDDDLSEISQCDWVLEAIIEDAEIKKNLYALVELHRKPGSIISSNTSGIPLKILSEGRSEDFIRHFCGTHFFNPPRYLPLLEIIPGPATNPAILAFLQHFCRTILGKTAVLCKDTPAFIANRIGVFSMLDTARIAMKLGLSVSETDKLTGPVIGRPKSATFRTADVVGLDTLLRVATGLNKLLGKVEIDIPEPVLKMAENRWLGEKSGQGFYKKVVLPDGKKEFLQLNLSTMEFESPGKAAFQVLEKLKAVENPEQRWHVLMEGIEVSALFYREMLGNLFWYSATCLLEISDEISILDAAIEAGFGWDSGPFTIWQALGFSMGMELVRETGKPVPDWLEKLAAEKDPVFFRREGDNSIEWSPLSAAYISSSKSIKYLKLSDLRGTSSTVFSNSGASLHDLGDGIACLEFHSKMNTLGTEVVEGLNKAFDLSEENFRGLVIGNQGSNFSAGANLGLVFMYAMEQEFEEIDSMVRQFQRTVMRVRYSGIPAVIAPHGLSLGGACEMLLHADGVQAAAESYIGLVETSVGLIPGGGGTKEMARRMSLAFQAGDPELNRMQNTFMSMAMAKVSESAHHAFELGYLQKGDRISMNPAKVLSDAKDLAASLAENGYVQPIPAKDIRVAGKSGMANLEAGIYAMEAAGKISAHDRKVATKLSYVLNGGELSYPQMVTEQYLLDLEREAFLSLCGERKTLERMKSLLSGGKILRN